MIGDARPAAGPVEAIGEGTERRRRRIEMRHPRQLPGGVCDREIMTLPLVVPEFKLKAALPAVSISSKAAHHAAEAIKLTRELPCIFAVGCEPNQKVGRCDARLQG